MISFFVSPSPDCELQMCDLFVSLVAVSALADLLADWMTNSHYVGARCPGRGYFLFNNIKKWLDTNLKYKDFTTAALDCLLCLRMLSMNVWIVVPCVFQYQNKMTSLQRVRRQQFCYFLFNNIYGNVKYVVNNSTFVTVQEFFSEKKT